MNHAAETNNPLDLKTINMIIMVNRMLQCCPTKARPYNQDRANEEKTETTYKFLYKLALLYIRQDVVTNKILSKTTQELTA